MMTKMSNKNGKGCKYGNWCNECSRFVMDVELMPDVDDIPSGRRLHKGCGTLVRRKRVPVQTKPKQEEQRTAYYIRVERVGHKVDVFHDSTNRTALCGARPWEPQTVKLYEGWPAKTKRCPKCREIWDRYLATGKMTRNQSEQPQPEVKADGVPQSDFKKEGVCVGDTWQRKDGSKFTVQDIDIENRGEALELRTVKFYPPVEAETGAEISTYRFYLLGKPYSMDRVFFYRLVERCTDKACGVKRAKAAPKAADKVKEEWDKAFKRQEKPHLTTFGVKVGDIWHDKDHRPFAVREIEETVMWAEVTLSVGDGKLTRVKLFNPPTEVNFSTFHNLFSREVKSEQTPTADPKPGAKPEIKAGDVWENEEGNSVEVIEIAPKGNKELAYVMYNRQYDMFGYLNNDHLFHRLIYRAEPKPETKKATAANPSPDIVSKGVMEGDLWQYQEEGKFPVLFRVVSYHDDTAFCWTEDKKPNHFLLRFGDRRFQKLVERDGKQVKDLRPQPNSGMDLATYGIHKGDKWMDINGHKFTVIVPEDDGKGRIVAVNIEWEKSGSLPMRERLTEVRGNEFYYLMERDGKNMEEA